MRFWNYSTPLATQQGLELYFQQGHSMFVSFESREDRERFVNLLQRQPSMCAMSVWRRGISVAC